MIDINKMIDFSNLQKINAKSFGKRRFQFSLLSQAKGKHMVGLVGPRGVGKTILLKQLAAEMENSIYISCDLIRDDDLLSLVDTLTRNYGFGNFFLDEIHFIHDFSISLKAIFDLLPNIRIYFSSSVAVVLHQMTADLSRRVQLYPIMPFSFREYLFFKQNLSLDPISWQKILAGEVSAEILQSGAYFDEYLSGGMMPYALDEPQPILILSNILNTILEKDLPRIAAIKSDEIDLIRKTVKFMSRNPGVDGISYSSISKNIGITKYKAQQYLEWLEKAFVTKQLLPHGAGVTKEPKVLMYPPYRLIERSLQDALGGLREDFFVFAVSSSTEQNMTGQIHYLKSMKGTKTPDFLLVINEKKLVFEVGGSSKTANQFKGLDKNYQKIILSHGIRGVSREQSALQMPLHAIGFLA